MTDTERHATQKLYSNTVILRESAIEQAARGADDDVAQAAFDRLDVHYITKVNTIIETLSAIGFDWNGFDWNGFDCGDTDDED